MDKISITLGLPADQVEQFKKDYREVWSGAVSRSARPGLWRIWIEDGEIMVEVSENKSVVGYNVADELWSISERCGSPTEIANVIEEIGTPSAIEVANHIREDLKNV
jgi:hypothetical protein